MLYILKPLLSVICFIHLFCPPALAGKSLEYHSETLIITAVGKNTYKHISYLETDSFGKVDCNGMIVIEGNNAMIFDTPATEEAAEELLRFLADKKKIHISAVVATHFHSDCVGGLKAFKKRNIPSYAGSLTRKLIDSDTCEVPEEGFEGEKRLALGRSEVQLYYPGEGHTRDNIVAYFHKDKVLFGGCLVKCLGAGKGYLGDSNETLWPGSIQAVKARFPEVKVVIPGHGDHGTADLLDYTIELFERK